MGIPKQGAVGVKDRLLTSPTLISRPRVGGLMNLQQSETLSSYRVIRGKGQSSECETVLNGLAGSPTCAQLQDTTQKYAPTVQNGDCAAVKSVLARFPTTTECCPALRRLVTSVSARPSPVWPFQAPHPAKISHLERCK